MLEIKPRPLKEQSRFFTISPPHLFLIPLFECTQLSLFCSLLSEIAETYLPSLPSFMVGVEKACLQTMHPADAAARVSTPLDLRGRPVVCIQLLFVDIRWYHWASVRIWRRLFPCVSPMGFQGFPLCALTYTQADMKAWRNQSLLSMSQFLSCLGLLSRGNWTGANGVWQI